MYLRRIHVSQELQAFETDLSLNSNMKTRFVKTVGERDPIARDLHTPKYHMRVVPNKRAYQRRAKNSRNDHSSL